MITACFLENGECSICSLFKGWQKNLNALPSMGCNDFKCILIPLYYFNPNEIHICHLKAQPTCILLQGLTKVLRFIAIYVRQLLEIANTFKKLQAVKITTEVPWNMLCIKDGVYSIYNSVTGITKAFWYITINVSKTCKSCWTI